MNTLIKLARAWHNWVTPKMWGPVLGGSVASVASGTQFVSSVSGGTARNDFTGQLGYSFTVGASPITVNQLSRYIVSGNSGSHTVYIYGNPGTTIDLIAQVSINTSGATASTFKSVSITPVVLS